MEAFMSSRAIGPFIVGCALLTILAMPTVGHAQEATLTGVITDTTGGVLPGATIKAVNEDSGNSFEAATGGRRACPLAVPLGNHQITATLSGFDRGSPRPRLQVGH